MRLSRRVNKKGGKRESKKGRKRLKKLLSIGRYWTRMERRSWMRMESQC